MNCIQLWNLTVIIHRITSFPKKKVEENVLIMCVERFEIVGI